MAATQTEVYATKLVGLTHVLANLILISVSVSDRLLVGSSQIPE